jgi:TRAP-type C4-dicarboxylate transport system permease small subunit
MRVLLDKLYLGSGLLAAFFLFMIGLLVIAQIFGRLFDFLIPSADDFARLCLAASSFLALAYTLRQGAHIRVSLLLERLPPAGARVLELLCLAFGTALMGYFSYYCFDMVRDGILYPDYTIGLIPIPKWIPQIGMTVGVVLLFIAFLDDLICVLSGKPASYQQNASDNPEDRHAAHE